MQINLNDIVQYVFPICGSIAAIVMFWRNVLQTRKLNLEVKQLKKKIEAQDSKIEIATFDEIEKYGKHVDITQKIHQSTLLVFFAIFLGAPFFMRTVYQSQIDEFPIGPAGPRGESGPMGPIGPKGDSNVFDMFAGSCSAVAQDFRHVGDGRRVAAKTVRFSRPFTSKPNIVLSISALDVARERNQRVRVYPTGITSEGFVCNIETWSNTHIFSAGDNWFAYKANKTNQSDSQ